MCFPSNLTDCAVICKSKFHIDLKMPKSKAEDFDCKIKFVRICLAVKINYLFWKDNDLFCVLFRVIAKSLWIKRLLHFYCKLKHSHKIFKCCLMILTARVVSVRSWCLHVFRHGLQAGIATAVVAALGWTAAVPVVDTLLSAMSCLPSQLWTLTPLVHWNIAFITSKDKINLLLTICITELQG